MASGRSPVTPGRPPSPQEPRLLSRSWVIRGPHDPPLWLNLAHRAGLGPAPSRPLWESPTWTAARAAGRPFKRPHRQAALRAGLRWTDAQEPSGRPRGAGRTVWVPGPGQPQPQGGAVGERGRAPPRPGSGHGSWEAPGSAGTERSHRGLTGVTEPPGGTPGACPARECAVPPDLCPGHRTGGPGSSARPGGHTRREPFSASSSRLLWVVRGLAGTSPSPAKGGGRGPVRAPAGDRPLRSERTRVSAAQPDPTLAPKEPECAGMCRNAPECAGMHCSQVDRPVPQEAAPSGPTALPHHLPAPGGRPSACAAAAVDPPSWRWLRGREWEACPRAPPQDQFICQSSRQVESRPSWRPARPSAL